ncbi:MAG: hypothetical protein OXT67_13945 [Zetaproteobacteria bacterium]|nr:hypothetical protein [Zetaproteobacteria bacterium]
MSWWITQRISLSLARKLAALLLIILTTPCAGLDATSYLGSGKSAVAAAPHPLSWAYQPANLYWSSTSFAQYSTAHFNGTGKDYYHFSRTSRGLSQQEKNAQIESLYGRELFLQLGVGAWVMPFRNFATGVNVDTNVAAHVQGRSLPEVAGNVWARASAPAMFAGSAFGGQAVWGLQLIPDFVLSQRLREDLIEIYEDPSLVQPRIAMEQNLFFRGKAGMVIPKRFYQHEFRFAATIDDFLIAGPNPGKVFDSVSSVGQQPYEMSQVLGLSYGQAVWLKLPLTIYVHAAHHLQRTSKMPNDYHNRIGLRCSINHGRVMVDSSMFGEYKSMSVALKVLGLRVAYAVYREPLDLGAGVRVSRKNYVLQLAAMF